MEINEINNIKSQMRKGLLEYLILLLLSKQRAYPSDIIIQLQKANIIVVEGTIYTLFNRLRREAKLNYEWEESPKGPPRKYYSLTPYGEETLTIMKEVWEELSNAALIFQKQ